MCAAVSHAGVENDSPFRAKASTTLTTKKVSKWRSGLIVGAIVVATLVTFLSIKGRNTGSNGDPGGGGGNPI